MFVDIGGVDGLVPSREILGDPPAIGTGLQVRILEIDRAQQRLTLSARDPANDPWNRVGTDFVRGGIYPGVVARAAPFGAFVELAEGVVGLVHSSRLPGGLPRPGTSMTVRIAEIDGERQRLELAPAKEGAESVAIGQWVEGTVAEVLHNAVVVQLEDGRSGWLPQSEVELPAGTVLAQRYRKGKALKARIVDDTGRRVSLSLREDPATADRAWRAHASEADEGSFGTLGDLLAGWKPK